MKLKFSDGIEIDTSGPLRPLHLHDGWYVVGEGMCIPVRSRKEALAEIKGIVARQFSADTKRKC